MRKNRKSQKMSQLKKIQNTEKNPKKKIPGLGFFTLDWEFPRKSHLWSPLEKRFSSTSTHFDFFSTQPLRIWRIRLVEVGQTGRSESRYHIFLVPLRPPSSVLRDIFKSMTPSLMQFYARGKILMHQLLHATFFKVILKCHFCNFICRRKVHLMNHLTYRKGYCPELLEQKIQRLYETSEKTEEGQPGTRGNLCIIQIKF